MSGLLQVITDQIFGDAMERHVARFFSLAGHLKMENAAALVLEIPHPELAQLLPPESMIEQGRQNRTVPQSFQGSLGWCHEQLTSLVIGNRRRLTFLAFHLGTLHTLDGIMGYGVLVFLSHRY
jgi:hypothetical protein